MPGATVCDARGGPGATEKRIYKRYCSAAFVRSEVIAHTSDRHSSCLSRRRSLHAAGRRPHFPCCPPHRPQRNRPQRLEITRKDFTHASTILPPTTLPTWVIRHVGRTIARLNTEWGPLLHTRSSSRHTHAQNNEARMITSPHTFPSAPDRFFSSTSYKCAEKKYSEVVSGCSIAHFLRSDSFVKIA